ncbi:hypothetical protein LX16_0922 [Stackebrandtia albiflava]|uniref:N-acetyltransferase domain-containing protein n=1 Tax=Stackebrandtia albiflava TaxID=406432 RepID=A0A562VBJ2_9ACTN|nr:GNAT family N-acetyltransferase [Stackebrandtia albiflava]TWJ15222.1 hypothetical protein LX16_0922 [Stackebrandtia albiflava]
MTVEITDNPDRQRYEAHVDGRLAGFTEYDRHDEYTVFPHTEVGGDFRGMGVAGALVRAAADELRASGGRAYPLCPYVKSWFDKHPEYQDVVYTP